MKPFFKMENVANAKIAVGRRITFLLIAFVLLLSTVTFGQTYQVNGNAVNSGGGLVRMTSSAAGSWQISSAWSTTKHDLTQPFDMTFDMFFGCESGANGGDGMTFTFQNQSATSIGGGGGFLGIGGGPIVSPSISIEFDTYDGTSSGGTNEIAADHIAIDINGDVNNTGNFFTGSGGTLTTVQAINGGKDLESCLSMANDPLTIRITWNPATHTLELYEEGVKTLSYTNDIVNTIFGGNTSVFWGFTASTGTASNEQWIAPAGAIIPWSCTPSTTCCTPFTVTPTGPNTVCNTPITVGTAASYASYSWSTGATTPSVNISTPGTYTVNVLQNQAGFMCPGTATVTINPTGPTATLSGGATLCNDGATTPLSVAFTGTAPWSLTYSIDGVAQTPVTGITASPYVFNGTAQHTYTLVSVSDNGGCNGVVSGTANVNAYAGLPVGHDNTFTPPGTTLLTVDNGGGTYDWYDNLGNLVYTGTNFNTPTLNSTTTYYVQNSALSPFTSKSVALSSTSDPIAGGGATPRDLGLPKGVNWLDFTANSNFAFTRVTCAINVLASWAPSRISVTIQDLTAGTSYTKDSTVTAPLTPGIQNFYLNLAYNCVAGHTYKISYEGQTSTGALGGSMQAVMYWNLVTINPTPYHITNNPEVNITQNSPQTQRYPGLFDWRITVGVPASTCGRTPVTAIAVIPPCYAPISVTLNPTTLTTLCEGANQTITGTADLTGLTPTNGNYYYRWYKGTTPLTTYSTTYADLVLTGLTPADGGDYILRVEDGNTGTLAACYKQDTVRIVVNATIVAGAIATNQTICAGNTAAAFTSTTAGSGGDLTVAQVYQWQSSPDGTTGWTDIVGATSSTYSPGAVITTTYYRRNYSRGTYCTMASSNVVSITVNPALTAGAIDADQTICTNTAPVALTETTAATGGDGTYTYQWQSSANGTTGWTNIAGATAATYAPAALTTTIHYRRVVSSGTCSSQNSNVITITVQPNVTPAVSISNPGQICVGTNATFTATPTNGGTSPTYQWYLNGATAGTNSNTYSNSSLANGDQVYVVMTTNPVISCATATGATSSQITMTVKTIPAPQIIGNDTTICSGNTVHLTSITGAGTMLSWNNGGAPTGVSTSFINITTSGVYTLTENNGACATTSAPVIITVTPTPAANAGPDQYLEDGTTSALNGSGGATFLWTPATGLSDPSVANPGFTAKNTITYTLTVSDASGNCSSSDEVTIFVEKLIGIPNAITPNGDNNNDTWTLKNIQSFPNCTVEIYNRWGSLVWKSTGYNLEWDGSNFRNGEGLPDGTYFYIIDLKSKIYSDPYTGYIQIVK